MKEKSISVTFVTQKLEQRYEQLKTGKIEDRQLAIFIDNLMQDLKKNSACGTKIRKKLWPKVYIKKYGITNLWKYDLPSAWRLIYTIKTNEFMILIVVLEWFNHQEYERRFKY